MRWSWKIATVNGIAIYVHATLLLLLGWILLGSAVEGHGVAATMEGAALVALLFLCVLLHELGHAVTAQRFGIRTRDITLYPIGGIARLERIPRDPRQELMVASAGPLVNVVIAAALLAGLNIGGAVSGMNRVQLIGGNPLATLMWFNVVLVVFNLLPAFPMDGGRVLRAFLAERLEYARATHIAASVGQAMAFAFAFVGLLVNPLLLFIALFVFVGASQEASMVDMELAFRGVPVRRVMMTQFATLSPADLLASAVDHLLSGAQRDFPVVESGEMLGILTHAALMRAVGEHGSDVAVREAMLLSLPPVAPGDSLEATFQRMREAQAQALPVMEHGQLIGLVTLENIGEFLMVHAALQHAEQIHHGSHDGPATRAGVGEPVPDGRRRAHLSHSGRHAPGA